MKKIYFYLACLTGCWAGIPFTAPAQQAPVASTKRIQSVVIDDDGAPIKGASVFGNEGVTHAKTDEGGRFSIEVPGSSELYVEAAGYESALFGPGEYGNLDALTLAKTPFRYGKKDNVEIAFGKVKKGDLIHAANVLDPHELRKFDNTQTVASAITGMLPGLLGSNNIRGIGPPLYIVDGLPRDPSSLNLAEVESITLLKDINSTILYGNNAVNGVVVIKTKRGQAYKREINVQSFRGLSNPTALPEFVPSAEYMELYNEARRNDGLGVQFDPAMIENYRNGNEYRYPNTDYFSSDYLNGSRPFSRTTMDFSGGNSVASYYSNVGWTQTGSLLNFGEGRMAKSNTFNVRGNIDLKINDWITTSLDAVVVLDNNRGVQGNYWANAATLRPHLFAPLLPISLINPESPALAGRKNDVDGMYMLGGTAAHPTNPIASAYSGGRIEQVRRNFSFNNRINFDLGRTIQGLVFRTNLSFEYLTMYDQSVNNQYAVYEPVWHETDDRIVSLRQFGEDVRTGTQNVGNGSYRRRIGFYGMFDYDRTFNENHHVTGSLIAFLTGDKVQNDYQGSNNANLGLRLGYGYRNKYLVNFSGAYVNSAKLPEGNRTAFSPSLGVAWVVSAEDFMPSGGIVNYLKLRASAGAMNSDRGIGGFFYYNNRFGSSGGYSWYEGTLGRSGTTPINGGNPHLGFEKRSEINAGFESMLFNNSITLDANVFFSVYSDIITRPQTIYPSYFTNYIPYQNFDKNAYRGAELGISYHKNVGDFSFTVGANGLYASSEVIRRDELYADAYRFRTGHPVDARFGLVADGLFNSASEVENHAIQAFGAVKPGDIRFVDQNGDGVIDLNDEKRIGRSQAPFSYGLNFKVAYKNFTLFARGNGRSGADGMLSGNYFWVDGDKKYSTVVRDRWTEASMATATFPRLSSIANTNNYQSSTFWLYRDDYFTVDRVQMTYDMTLKQNNKLNLRTLSFFVDASNLATISKARQYRELNVGMEPQFRSYSLGFNAWF